MTCYWLALSRAKLGGEKPLIGINGAQTGLDVARMMLAGASAVEIASAVQLRGYDVLSNAVAEFGDYLAGKNVSAMDLIGRAVLSLVDVLDHRAGCPRSQGFIAQAEAVQRAHPQLLHQRR